MFKVECYCDDKNVARVLRALASAGALEVKPVPVAGAEVVNGKLQGNAPGGAVDVVWNDIKKNKWPRFTSETVQTILSANGFKPSGAVHVAKQLRLRKLIKMKSAGNYEVMK